MSHPKGVSFDKQQRDMVASWPTARLLDARLICGLFVPDKFVSTARLMESVVAMICAVFTHGLALWEIA